MSIGWVWEQPRGSLGFFSAAVSVPVHVREITVFKEVNGARFDGDGIVEGCDGDSLVAASEWVGGVDVAVARNAEGCGVGLARDVCWGLLADLADQDTLVTRR